MSDDMLDAFKYVPQFWKKDIALAAGGSPTGRMTTRAPAPAPAPNRRGGKSVLTGIHFSEHFLNTWAMKPSHQVKRKPIFILDNIFEDIYENTNERKAMQRALKDAKSQHLHRWRGASFKEQDDFVARVRRQGVKPYPNLKHMRDLYAAFMAELVFAELKE